MSRDPELFPRIQHDSARDWFFWQLGRFAKYTLPITSGFALTDDEIYRDDPEDTRMVGRWTLGVLVVAAALSAGVATAYVSANDGFQAGGEGVEDCHFSDETTVVTRMPSQSDEALVIVHTTGVNYNHGDKEGAQWIKDHNPESLEQPNEQIVIPRSLNCGP